MYSSAAKSCAYVAEATPWFPPFVQHAVCACVCVCGREGGREGGRVKRWWER